jgi:lipopolysaccharide transport system permease protein
MVTSLLRHRDLIGQMLFRDIRLRYHGSQLGFVWSLLTPLIMLGVYTFVFSTVLRARWDATNDSESAVSFALTMLAGLIPFNLFSEVTNRSPLLVLSVPNYVKKVVFPLEILSVVAVGGALFQSVIYVSVLLVGVAALEGRVSPLLPLLPLAYVPLILLTLGLSWFISALGVYLRDVGQVVGVITQAALFMTPIIYPIEAVPEQLRGILAYNPLTPIIDYFRHVLIWGNPPSWEPWLVVTLGSVVLAFLGHWWFETTKRGFADVM